MSFIVAKLRLEKCGSKERCCENDNHRRDSLGSVSNLFCHCCQTAERESE